MTSPDSRPAVPAWHVGLAVFVYLACWALIRPPLQSPDEPQHLMKANSVWLQPWLNDISDQFVPDRRRVNPLAWETPAILDKLFFQPLNALTPSEVDVLRATPWLAPDGPALTPYQRAIATYPQVYYWSVHAVAEPVIRAAALNPWDATFVYRLATCALVAILWALVWIACRRAAIPQDVAGTLVTFVLLTPMLAFISSSSSPDAVNDAVCALAIVAAWRVLTLGTGAAPFALALLAAMLTKPSGLQLAAVLALVGAGFGILGLTDRRRAALVTGITIAVTVLAVVVFYAWQPLRFLATGPSTDSFAIYVGKRWAMRSEMWVTYWGQLGWLDYNAPLWWYALILALVAVNIACLIWRPRQPARLIWYLGAVWILFVLSTLAAEVRYLREAGYTFQGRYLLPAAIGLGAVLLHRVRAARIALLAGVLALNLVLVHATVRRYYVGGWKGAIHALPFR
ncbi:MAG: DUF2142 domain-containing protein [Vicinamibacteraceae bacterium]